MGVLFVVFGFIVLGVVFMVLWFEIFLFFGNLVNFMV